MSGEAFLYWIVKLVMALSSSDGNAGWESKEETSEMHVASGVEISFDLLDRLTKNAARKRTSRCLYYVTSCEGLIREKLRAVS